MSRLEINKILADSSNNSLEELKAALRLIEDPEERAFAEQMFALGARSISESPRHQVIVLIHGIRTEAIWQESLIDELQKISNVEVFPIGYGYFDTFDFLCPFFTRARPVNKVLRELRTLRTQYPQSDISVVAHSFGTYIVSKILDDATDIRFHRIQLCGAVVHQNFRWDKVISRVTGKIVNDAGSKDIYPPLAKAVTWGFGHSGTVGFKTIPVKDRYFDFGHSDFFKASHMRNYWLPFLLDGQVKSSPFGKRRNPSKAAFWLSLLPLKLIWLVPPSLLVFLVWIALGYFK